MCVCTWKLLTSCPATPRTGAADTSQGTLPDHPTVLATDDQEQRDEAVQVDLADERDKPDDGTNTDSYYDDDSMADGEYAETTTVDAVATATGAAARGRRSRTCKYGCGSCTVMRWTGDSCSCNLATDVKLYTQSTCEHANGCGDYGHQQGDVADCCQCIARADCTFVADKCTLAECDCPANAGKRTGTTPSGGTCWSCKTGLFLRWCVAQCC